MPLTCAVALTRRLWPVASLSKAARFPNHPQILATCSFWFRTQRSNGHGTSHVEPGRGDASMQALRLHRYNERPTVDEIEEPKVEGPHDVIVKIGGAGLCRTDIHLYLGQWHELDADAPLPYTLGHENAGWVHEVGSDVSHVAPGDTVILHPQATCGFCRYCRAGDDMHCVDSFFPGLNTDAGMATYHAVRKAVPLLYPGTTCVVIGAGGLGHIGIQVLAALCATTIIVVDRNPEALEFAKTIGATHGVAADGTQVDQVKELTGGNGAEVVLDFVGEEGSEKDAWAMTREAGSHFVIGYGGKVEVPTIEIISTERNVIGNIVGTYNDLAELMALGGQGHELGQGKVTLHTRPYPLEAANDAIDDLDNGRLPGTRAILIPI